MPLIPEPCILIGTAQTLLPLSLQTASLAALASPLGWVLVGPGRPRGGRILGFAHDLALIHRAMPFASAIACVPESHRREISLLRAQLSELGVHQVWMPAIEDVLHAAGSPVADGPAPIAASIRWEQLIAREAHPVNRESISRVLSGKRVLDHRCGWARSGQRTLLASPPEFFEPSLLVLMERDRRTRCSRSTAQIARRPRSGLPRRAVLHDVVDADADAAALFVALKPAGRSSTPRPTSTCR
jgi:hypothetical protein